MLQVAVRPQQHESSPQEAREQVVSGGRRRGTPAGRRTVRAVMRAMEHGRERLLGPETTHEVGGIRP